MWKKKKRISTCFGFKMKEVKMKEKGIIYWDEIINIKRFEKTVTGICYIETGHSKSKRKEINMINTI